MEFSKQGFGTEDALKLSKIASEFQNIADTEIDAATAAKFINSQIKAFGNTDGFKQLTSDAEKAERVIDAVNEVANNFGVGTNDLQMALTKTGAALKGYGNSYSETIGLITAGTEMLPNQASKVARGWRTIGANVLKLAQSEETLEAANGKVNISLRDSQGNMKSTFDILQDLHTGIDGQSVAWKDLSQEEQSAISLMLAGKTQTEVFKSTMDNFSQAIKANETALNSQGSAARENAKYLDSIQGHLASFQSAWEKLSYDLIDSKTIKSFIDIGTGAINVIDKIVNALDKLPGKTGALVGLVSIFSGILGAKKLWSIAEGMVGISKGVEAVGATAKTTTSFTSLFAKDLTSWVAGGTSVIGTLGMLAGAVAVVGTAFYIANEQYKNSFRGKVDEYHKIGNEIESIQSEIETLTSKEGELTGEEQTRLNLLKMQLQVLEKQQAITQKEATQAFNKEAKKNLAQDVSGLAKDSQAPDYGGKYIKAMRERLSLEKQIAAIQEESAKSGKVNEKQLEKLNKQYEEAVANEGDWLEALIEQHDLLSEVSYDELDNWGKTYYDNIHKAYLQAQSDIRSVQDAVGNAVDAFGSQQFDAWNIDISSLKSAADLAEQIKSKISELGDDEEITIYARDESGNIIDAISQKKGELTNEEWELVVDATTSGNYDKLKQEIDSGNVEHKDILMQFIPEGEGNVESVKSDLSESETTPIKFEPEGAEKVDATKKSLAKDETTTVGVKTDGGENKIRAGLAEIMKPKTATVNVTERGLKSVKSEYDSIKPKTVNVTINKTTVETTVKKAGGKRKGEKGGMAWLGDEGSAQNPKPELVVSEDGAYLAGTQGWEMRNLKPSDTVYTYAQTKKLLNGSQTFSFAEGSEIPRFKKGKKTKAKTQTRAQVQKKASKKQKEKWQKEFDKKLQALKHKAKVQHWSDAKYQAEYKKLYNAYYKKATNEQLEDYQEANAEYLNKVAKDSFSKQVKSATPESLSSLISAIQSNSNLSADDKAELIESATETANKVGHDRAEKDFSRRTGLISATGTAGLSGLVKDVQANQYLTAEEKQDTIAKAYQTAVEYNLKEYQNGKATRNDILKDIQNYYNTRGQYDETYYEMVDKLRQADKEKELKRLSELEKKEENKLSYIKKYAQRQKEYYDEQVKKEKEEAEALEELVELQDKLNNAKKTMIKVYKEGEGFVYEQDTQAIREAQKALEDYNKEQQKSDLEQKAEAWQKIIDAIGEAEDLSEMKELELALGITNISQITGNIGLDANKWGNLAKTILATQMGLEDISKILSEAEGADIEKLIGATLSAGNKQISNSLLSQYFAKHSFASGTLSSPSGFSIVGENGPELRYLSKGSAIFSNRTSRNLMEWGQYSPAQVLSSVLGGTQSQVFNFDKIVLPNVHNADEFYKELQALPNRAIQQSTFRM